MSRDESNLPPELRAVLEQKRTDGEASDEDLDWDAVWALADRAAPPDEALPDAEDTWAGVRDHIEEEQTEEKGTEQERRGEDRRPRRPSSSSSARRRRWGWGTAAVVVLMLAVGAWWWAQPVEITASPGTTVSHSLPDGSTVELHGGTRLTHSRAFSTVPLLEAERRVVRLQGEAYFEVEPGGRPFVVQTPSMRVEVVGTAFSVRSRPDEADNALVALAEGRLRVTGPSAADTTRTLRPGQAATLAPDGTLRTVRDTSIERITAWRRGGFAATARSLPALAQALERRFGAPIRLDASIGADTRSAPLTLYYSEGVELNTILRDVCMARGLTYRATARGYVLARADDPESPQLP